MMKMTCVLPPQLLHSALTRPQSCLQERQLRRQSCGDTGTGLPWQPETPVPILVLTLVLNQTMNEITAVWSYFCFNTTKTELNLIKALSR